MSKPNADNADWSWDRGPIGRLVKTAHIVLRRELEEQLKQVDLTHAQWSALTVIRHFGVVTASELELILMIERPSVTSLINGMVRKGLVVRRSDPKDARFKQIFLTEKGKQLAEETQYFTRIIEDRVKEGLTQAEFEELRSLLIKMIGIFMNEN